MIVCDTPSNYSSTNEKKDGGSFTSKKIQNILRSLNIEDAYITNLVKCGSINRLKKTDLSIRNCWQFMLREVDLVNPQLILCVGRTVFDIMSKRNLRIPIEYVPHYNYKLAKRTLNRNNNFLSSEDTIINLWKEAITKHI